jgi:hypothetical protein
MNGFRNRRGIVPDRRVRLKMRFLAATATCRRGDSPLALRFLGGRPLAPPAVDAACRSSERLTDTLGGNGEFGARHCL